MSDISKTDPLLGKNSNSDGRKSNRKDYFRGEDWWTGESGTSSSSEYSLQSDAGCKAEWENHVNSRGEVFYYEPLSQKDNTSQNNENVSSIEKTNISSLEKEPTTGILIRLIRRRSSRRSFRRKDDDENRQSKSQGKNTVNRSVNSSNEYYLEETDLREVTIHVDPENTYNFGRRASALETILGLVTISDDSQLLVSGYATNFQKFHREKIRIGDYLHSINGVRVTSENVDSYLSTIKTPQEVLLMVRSSYRDKSTSQVCATSKRKEECRNEFESGLLYAKLDGLTEGGPADQGIIYSYPDSLTSLCLVRGSFFTLQHLLPDVTSAQPISTTVRAGTNAFHIVYTLEDKELLLLSLPNCRYTLKEAIRVNADLVRCLCFVHQSLSKCFLLQNKHYLDDFFNKIFVKINNGMILEGIGYASEFEDILPASSFISLPKEAQVHIDDALNELEANDIGAFDSERLYSVIGSCFYHKGYMICSHLTKEDLIDITSLCRHYDLLRLCHDGVKDLIFWKEVYPASCQRGSVPFSTLPYSTPHGRWFVLIVGQVHDMLCVLLESGGCTARIDGNPGPNVLYVEETQATLEHIQKIGIPKFTSKWLEANSRTEEPIYDSQSKLNTDSGIFQYSDFNRSTQSIHSLKADTNLSTNLKTYDSQQPQVMFDVEDHFIQGSAGNLTESGPVLGRRAERERIIETNSQSRESDFSDDSDWTKDRKSFDGSQPFNMSDMGKALLSEEHLLPSKFTWGTNSILLHYVHLDSTEGILLSSLPSSNAPSNIAYILHNFRRHAHHIHNILMNTVSFKKMKIQEMTANIVNKSLVAIKEHGILFESINDNEEKKTPISYWVIGRLFFVPHPREVYVCYQDTCPQNMVEIAFRLALSVLSC